MVEYAGGRSSRIDAPSNPSAQFPPALNARLDIVRENLNGALKVLAEVRARLGVADTPENANKAEPVPPGAAGTTMDLLAQSARLQTLLRETLEAIG